MKAKEKSEACLKELKAVLAKYNASLFLEDKDRCYLRDYHIMLEFDYDGNLDDSGIIDSIDLGSWQN